MRLSYLPVFALLWWASAPTISAADETDPPYAFLQPSRLASVKQQLRQNTERPQTRLAYDQLLAEADRALDAPNPSVTRKTATPPSGSRHDYLSLGAYWWPDPHQADGFPWVRRDGQVNPASKDESTDGVRLATFTSRVQALTLAWYFSGRQQYADKAIAMIRTWFIDPATRMNPNLNYAQGIPGIATGRGAGVLDGRYFSTRIVDSLIMLRKAPGWTTRDEQHMRRWMSEYLHWLQTSQPGRKEAAAKNNHGSWYAVQTAGIAWYVGETEVVKSMAALLRRKLDHQLMPDGSQPEELARTRSFHYSYFNLQAITDMAVLAARVGENLWQYQTPQGSSLPQALDFMAPYLDEHKAWPHKTLDRRSSRLIPLMLQADQALKTPRYRARIEQAGFSALLSGEEEVGRGKARPVVGMETRRALWLLSSAAGE
ncbi:alginate lyase family protein [Brenneria tiliae]|uniref:alginate lyase family protein n=1 Tax=Brenneria tiliae TaxID=2914984 RepID=UPI002014F534|nr:alginate lyase family protein [Brenneria tiliae]MCL2898071.1 alginate lyase family protein [Brenneria tiliae]MCL2902152.1 alginate lyase family protein [Brenneria tiliae]